MNSYSHSLGYRTLDRLQFSAGQTLESYVEWLRSDAWLFCSWDSGQKIPSFSYEYWKTQQIICVLD